MKTMTVTGNLGHDPEARYTPQGEMVANASIAVNSGYGDKKTTEWMDITLWGKSAETFVKLAQKGTKVLIYGVPKIEVWVGKKDKEPHAKINLTVREFEVLAGFAEREDSDNPYDDSPEAVDEVLQGE